MGKITKKDKLTAMLQMWIVLREDGKKRPWKTTSNEYVLQDSLQRELAIMLGVPLKPVAKPLLPKDQIILLIENLEKVQAELNDLKTEDNSRYGGSKMLDALVGMLKDKLTALANFEEQIELLKVGELPSPESG